MQHCCWRVALRSAAVLLLESCTAHCAAAGELQTFECRSVVKSESSCSTAYSLCHKQEEVSGSDVLIKTCFPMHWLIDTLEHKCSRSSGAEKSLLMKTCFQNSSCAAQLYLQHNTTQQSCTSDTSTAGIHLWNGWLRVIGRFCKTNEGRWLSWLWCVQLYNVRIWLWAPGHYLLT